MERAVGMSIQYYVQFSETHIRKTFYHLEAPGGLSLGLDTKKDLIGWEATITVGFTGKSRKHFPVLPRNCTLGSV